VVTSSGRPPLGLHRECWPSPEPNARLAPPRHSCALGDLGVELAIDDFGTGYSSLAYLRRLPVDILKVDGTFVAGLGASDEDGRIVRAIISLAHEFRLRVVAEGVETKLQYEIITSLGCDTAQGYLISPPMTREQTLVALERRLG
jgi:EAL domain-containing protein (putative c-di-GMP-specific phosphodiesterase class I)